MATRQENYLKFYEGVYVSNAGRLKGGIEKLVWALKMQERNILHNGRRSLEEISRQLDPELLSILGEDLCQQATDLVGEVHRSCAMLPNIFSIPEPAELVLLVEEQITICLCVLRAMSKVIPADAEKIVSDVKHWVNETRPFRQCNLVCPDEASDKLRRVITFRSHGMADLGLAILDALPNVLDMVDPNTKHERMLVRNNQDRAKSSSNEDDRQARQRKIEELGQERERRLQEIQACGDTHRADFWWPEKPRQE
ncbi:unnamed protein product [Clonostachys solani]|uniref:Uncharacterized protein n=1 Tax=Clonostachys solani TaxID=160281 RepID=A0A9N9YX27_9HYPO|nr:unnamed protein product [Clonostachys solani]